MQFYEILVKERTKRYWTQPELAEKLEVDVKTVSRWETGLGMPKSENRRKLCALFGKTPEELGFEGQRGPIGASAGQQSENQSGGKIRVSDANRDQVREQEANSQLENEIYAHENQLYMSNELFELEIPYQIEMHGREKELAELWRYIENDKCKIVSVIGIGGMGKTVLVAGLVKQLKARFEYVFWRSLQNIPQLHYILARCTQYFSDQQQVSLPEDPDEQIRLLIYYLRKHRCLLILDNFESVLQAGQQAGHYRKGYEEYGQLLSYVGEMQHQSCIILTSREKPNEIAYLEGQTPPVRTLLLGGLKEDDGCKVLEDKGLQGDRDDLLSLVRLYSGNPLALKLVTETVWEIFGGNIASFLQQGTAFVNINHLLDQHYRRLTAQEQEILYWLAIECEDVSLDTLRGDLVYPSTRQMLPDTLKSLLRRSLVENKGPALFTLQPVIMEYVTTHLIEFFVNSLNAETAEAWEKYALLKAQAKDYIRESQTRLYLMPVMQRLMEIKGKESIEQRLKQLLAQKQGPVSGRKTIWPETR
jgi:transcriptional regulator with XRE-family HTH domain